MRNIFCMMLLAAAVASCDEDTANIGVISNDGNLTVQTQDFYVTSFTENAGATLNSGTTCYLGNITDPETQTDINAGFMTQFYCFENYDLPSFSRMVKNNDGQVEADSIEVRLYYTNFYGDSLAPMKVNVYEMDTLRTLSESVKYNTNIEVADYLNPNRTEPIAKRTFSIADQTVADSVKANSNYYANIRFTLPKEYGTFILNKYYENNKYFSNSYQFIHHVCPGFYFKMEAGNGAMMYIDVATINVFYRYNIGDSVYNGVTRFSSTGEVIQVNKIENKGIDQLLSNADVTKTYIKSPSGTNTVVTLPINDIYYGHESDSVCSAKIVFTRLNNDVAQSKALSASTNILMVLKDEANEFFNTTNALSKMTASVSTFNSSNNTYTFDNIAKMVAHCKLRRDKAAQSQGMSTAAWEAANPTWNQVVLIPVQKKTNTDGTVVNVIPDVSLTSTRLVRGTENGKEIPLQIVYSRY